MDISPCSITLTHEGLVVATAEGNVDEGTLTTDWHVLEFAWILVGE